VKNRYIFSIFFLFIGCSTGPKNIDNVLATSAIDGLVLQGPIKPVQQIGDPNTAPLAGALITIINNANAAVVANVVSDTSGKFFVKVTAGTYTCTPQKINNSGLPRPLDPVIVQVPANTTVKDTLHYDTGIR
jgi:hypothetical protein